MAKPSPTVLQKLAAFVELLFIRYVRTCASGITLAAYVSTALGGRSNCTHGRGAAITR